jgi:magnesium-transporting ATPase (P-type)
MERRDWHSVDSESVLECLEITSRGLTGDEAQRRLKLYGANELQKAPTTTALTLFLGQFKSILVIILIFSAIVSAFISVRKDEPLTARALAKETH